MLTNILSSIGIQATVATLGKTLENINHPAAKTAAAALKTLDDTLQRGEVSLQELEEANRHAEAMAALHAKEQSAAYTEINQSLRAEIASDDIYVRRMRPTFGYLMAFTWAAQMFAVAYIIVFETGQASVVLNAVESLSAIWAVGLSVLGIYVYKRSEEKGVTPRLLPKLEYILPGRKKV